jgi:hypothetical protein
VMNVRVDWSRNEGLEFTRDQKVINHFLRIYDNVQFLHSRIIIYTLLITMAALRFSVTDQERDEYLSIMKAS